ncbi:hypothetical protein M409DRAFT_53529 [Zasmidium cellare ATCC 36951]|uniref:Uncharacterized protein n=1 Tax=Zasmidium cellare ATCC 36951 TaxID=1080233 RepID=A0A6A6CQY2_ZASCE|nr:uncharacterized protein M409DRAFT_53529 [Zasmidium cellare ATCC 36951]KAF2168232.1 hypothetical protein M409DRAFT_53529 [Zasmidium cellare ATCC 36951]
MISQSINSTGAGRQKVWDATVILRSLLRVCQPVCSSLASSGRGVHDRERPSVRRRRDAWSVAQRGIWLELRTPRFIGRVRWWSSQMHQAGDDDDDDTMSSIRALCQESAAIIACLALSRLLLPVEPATAKMCAKKRHPGRMTTMRMLLLVCP